jgi:2-keto-3-deoxy-L-rhamnonate aldolase RhmA
VENAAAIAAVDGIDGLLFGPADLAADLGHFGKTEHPDVLAAIERGLADILAAGKFAGMSVGDPSLAPGWLAKGCRFISVGGDVPLLVGGARRALGLAKGAAP